uniref:glutathione transferase n=2 Tax=Lygus hesperus TaxID=30085 RepID=A0A0A9Y5I3_LYGHE
MAEMKDIKLTYFNIMGLGETLRFMLSYMGKEFEDFRIATFQEWITKHKKNMPFGKLPLLEIDGKPYHQTMALCRWLAKKCDLAGDNDDEALEIDMMMDSFSDFRSMVWSYFYNSDKENKQRIRPRIIEEITPFYLKKFDEKIKEEGYLANRKLSWVDIYFVAVLGYFSFMIESDICSTYENIRDLRDRVHAIPNIKKWVERRPETHW